MSTLDALMYGVRDVEGDGVAVVRRSTLNFIGATVADVGGKTTVTLPGGSLKPGLSNVLYVDKAGSDATGARGNIGLPYLTISAALAAAQSGDVVQIGPGTWVEDVTLPGLAEISLVGAGRDQTRITGVANDATITAAPTGTALARCLISDLSVYNPGVGTGYSISISGTGLAAPGNFVSESAHGLVIRNVRTASDINTGVRVMCAGHVDIVGCLFDALTLRDIGVARLTGVQTYETAVVIRFDGATLPTGFTAGTVKMSACQFSQTSFYGRLVTQVTGSQLGTTLAALTTDGGDHGYLTAIGCSLGAVAVSGDSASTGAYLDVSSLASLAVTKTGAAAIRVAVSARGGAIAGAVSAGASCDVDIRGSSFVQSSLAVAGDGTIERSTHREAISLINGDTDVTFAVPFKTANYSVAYELTVAASPITPRANKAATGLRATSTAVDAFASFILTHD